MFFIQLLLARNEVEKHTTSKKVLKITERETVKVQSPHRKLSLSINCLLSQIRLQQFLYTPQVHNNMSSIYGTSKTDSD